MSSISMRMNTAHKLHRLEGVGQGGDATRLASQVESNTSPALNDIVKR